MELAKREISMRQTLVAQPEQVAGELIDAVDNVIDALDAVLALTTEISGAQPTPRRRIASSRWVH